MVSVSELVSSSTLTGVARLGPWVSAYGEAAAFLQTQLAGGLISRIRLDGSTEESELTSLGQASRDVNIGFKQAVNQDLKSDPDLMLYTELLKSQAKGDPKVLKTALEMIDRKILDEQETLKVEDLEFESHEVARLRAEALEKLKSQWVRTYSR